MKQINDENFYKEIKNEKVNLIDFWAPWCGPCKMLAPVLEELEPELENINFMKINIDENHEIAAKYGIMSIPTLLVMKNNEVIEELTGFRSKEDLKEILKKYN